MSREIRGVVVVNFDRFHPLNKTVSAAVRDGGPLKWVRWDCDAHRDPVLLDLPREERWLWPVLLALAGKQRRADDGTRTIPMTRAQLAREADLGDAQVEHALLHLSQHGHVRIVRRGGREGGADHREGGAHHRRGGYVPTDVRTDRTNLRGVQGGGAVQSIYGRAVS